MGLPCVSSVIVIHALLVGVILMNGDDKIRALSKPHPIKNLKINRYLNPILPALVWVAFTATLAACFLNTYLFFFNISGLSWSGCLLIALLILTQRAFLSRFPIYIWLPWLLVLILYLPESLASPHASSVSPIQRTFQLLTPVIVAIAISSYPIRIGSLRRFVDLFKMFLVALWVLSVLMNISAILALKTTGLAPQAMTAMLGCIFCLCRYFIYKEIRDLLFYLFMATLPILAVTRTAIAVTLMLPNILVLPVPTWKRALFFGGSILAAISVFFLPQVQSKMFYTGGGDLSEVNLDNDQLATSGRAYMWHYLTEFANQNPWFGHGTGQGETFVFNLTGLNYPHNDWLLTYTDYGIFGVIVFLLCNLWMMWDCWCHARKVRHPTVKLFFYAGASSFIPFMLMMFTDNIMVYASFFGILQYTIIGLAYGSLNTLKKRPKRKRKRVASLSGTPVLSTSKVDLPATG